MRNNKYLIFLYFIAFIIFIMQLYYGVIEPNSFGIGNTLYVMIYLLVITIIGFVYYSIIRRDIQWLYLSPFIFTLVVLGIIYLYHR